MWKPICDREWSTEELTRPLKGCHANLLPIFPQTFLSQLSHLAGTTRIQLLLSVCWHEILVSWKYLSEDLWGKKAQNSPGPSPSPSGSVNDGESGRSPRAALLQNKHPAALLGWGCSRESRTASTELRSVSVPIHWQPAQWDKPLITSQRNYVLRQQDQQKHSHRIMAIWWALAMIPFDAK